MPCQSMHAAAQLWQEVTQLVGWARLLPPAPNALASAGTVARPGHALKVWAVTLVPVAVGAGAEWCWPFPSMCHSLITGGWQKEKRAGHAHTQQHGPLHKCYTTTKHTDRLSQTEAVQACTHCTRRLLFTPSACWIELGQNRCRPVGWYTTKSDGQACPPSLQRSCSTCHHNRLSQNCLTSICSTAKHGGLLHLKGCASYC